MWNSFTVLTILLVQVVFLAGSLVAALSYSIGMFIAARAGEYTERFKLFRH